MTTAASLPTPAALAALLAKRMPDLVNVSPAATFDALGVDSLTMVEIAVVVTHAFGVQINDDEIPETNDITGLSDLIKSKIAASGLA